MKDDRQEYCRRTIDAELRGRGLLLLEWEEPPQDPPDYFLTAAGRRFAVEMTSTRHQIATLDGGAVQSEHHENVVEQVFHDLKREAIRSSLLRGTYCLSAFKPFASHDFRTHRKAIVQSLLDGLRQLADAPLGWGWELNGRYLDSFRLRKVEHTGSAIIRFDASCHGQPDWEEEGEAIIGTAIKDKIAKLNRLGRLPDPSILVVLNTHNLLDGPAFRQLANSVPEIRFFEAVFIVDRADGICTELTDSALLSGITDLP